MALLFWLRHRVPDPVAYEVAPAAPAAPPAPAEASAGPVAASARPALSPLVWQYITTVGLLSLGIVSFPLLAFHAQTQGLLTSAQVPLVFAVAMGVDGLSGLLMGRLYDRRGPAVLLLVPVAAGISAVAFTANLVLIWVGVAIWGVVNGVLDSTVKAMITELVEPAGRSIAFGWLALARGLGLLLAGLLLGLAYDQSIMLVVWLIVVINTMALSALVWVLARYRLSRR